MINDEISKDMSDQAELAVNKLFKNLGYSVCRPNHGKEKRAVTEKGKRPDFIICRSGIPEMICEVKAILSPKYLSDKDVPTGVIYDNTESRFKKIDDVMADAVRQRAGLVEAFPTYEQLPFLVALVPDFFNERFLGSYPRSFNKDVSAILTIRENVAIEKAADELTAEEQEQCFKAGRKSVSTPPDKRFLLIRNKAAARKVPNDFRMHCIEQDHDESV